MIATIGFAGREVYLTNTPIVIGFHPGGELVSHILEFEDIRRSGRHVRVDGMCISACTLLLGTIPSERLCATPFAQFAFHSASIGWGGRHSPEGTRLIWRYYSEALRQILRDRGWDGDPEGIRKTPDANAHQELLYLTVEDLRGVVRRCAD